MKIILDNVYAFYEEKNDEIEDFLRIKHPQRMYIEAYKNGTWDGYVRFVKKTPKGFYYFPSGFIFAFSDFFSKFEIVDKRKKKEVILKDYNLQGIQLRDYQIFSIEEALRKERGILNLATNSGKTEVSIAISKALSNLRVLYILHRQHLLFQTVKRFKDRIDEKIGYIGAGKKEGLDNRIVIASIQTFYSLIKNSRFRDYLKTFDVCFWDEVHHLQAETWYKVSRFINAYYRFGLSATIPEKKSLSLYRLIAMTGSVIYRLKQKELVDSGVSALPFIYIIDVPSGLKDFKIEYNDAYKTYIEEFDERNLLIKRVCEKFNDKRKVIVVKTIRHGEILKNGFLMSAVLLTGRESIWERLRVLEKFKKGEVKCIIATNWFEEGTDLPEVEVFINASGGLSDRQLIQRIGRALRKKEGENKVILVDFWDTANKYLLKHSKERLKIYKREGFDVKRVKLNSDEKK